MINPEDYPKLLEKINNVPEPVDVAEENPYLKMVLYGDGGVGKTVLSCRFGRTLLFSTDSGWTSTRNKHAGFALDVKKMDWTDPDSLRAVGKAIRYKISPYDNYDTFVLDTVSGASELYLDWLLENIQLEKRNAGTFKDPKVRVRSKPLEFSGFDDYHLDKLYFRRLFHDLNKAECNVFYIAHDKDPDFLNPGNKLQPDLPDKVYKAAFYNTQLMGRMTRDGDKRELEFTTNKKFAAKSRIDELDGKKVTDEQFVQIINKWRSR